MEFEIREASLDDAPALQRYAMRLFAERLPGLYEREMPTLEEEQEFIRAHTEPARSTMLLAVVDGQIVGLLGFLARTLAQESHVGLFGISVDQGFRDQGIGSALIESLLEWAPLHGIMRVEVEAFAVNERAVRLYERLGFEREGRRRAAIVIDGRPEDVIMMARLVAEP